MASLWTTIKDFFCGSNCPKSPSNSVERFCFTCAKMTSGILGPEQAANSEQQAKEFTCSECGKPTRVLE